MAISTAMRDMIKRQKAQYQNSNTNIKKCKDGKTRLRIVRTQVAAPGAEEGQFWLDYGVHWIKQPGNPKPLAVVGNSLITFGTPSPVEAMVEKAIASANTDEDIAFYKEMKCKKGVLINALNRTVGSEDASEDPAVYELTPRTWGDVWTIAENFDNEGVDIFDPNTGVDIIVEKTGKGKEGTRYTVSAAPSVKGCKPVPAEAIAKAIDLYAFVSKEFFRPGDDVKALSILADATGLAAPAISGPRPGSQALLTATKPVDDSAAVAAATAKLAAERKAREAEQKELEEIATAGALLEAEPEAEDDEMAKLTAKLAAMQAAKSAKAPAKTVAKKAATAPVVSAPAAEEEFGADLSEQLAELDGI